MKREASWNDQSVQVAELQQMDMFLRGFVSNISLNMDMVWDWMKMQKRRMEETASWISVPFLSIKTQSIIIFRDFIWYQVISYKLAPPPHYECLFINLIKIH